MSSEPRKEPSANNKDIADQWSHYPSTSWLLLGSSWQTNWSVQIPSYISKNETPLLKFWSNFIVGRWWEELASTFQFSSHLFTTSLHGFSLQFSRHFRCFLCLLHLKQLHSLLYLLLVLLWLLHLVLQTPASSITGSCSCFNMFIRQNCISVLLTFQLSPLFICRAKLVVDF